MATAIDYVMNSLSKKHVECKQYLCTLIDEAIKSKEAYGKLHGEEFDNELNHYWNVLSKINGCLWALHHAGIIKSREKCIQAERQIRKYIERGGSDD